MPRYAAMKVLPIDSSALGAVSTSRQLSAAAVRIICDSDTRSRVTYRDVAAALNQLELLSEEFAPALLPA
jgi:FMN-dependent NADH-azoreductase